MRCGIAKCTSSPVRELTCSHCKRYTQLRCALHRKILPKSCPCGTKTLQWDESRYLSKDAPTSTKKPLKTRSPSSSQKKTPRPPTARMTSSELDTYLDKRAYEKDAVDTIFKSVTLDSAMREQSGHWVPELTISGARSFSGDRKAQMLRHISAQLFWYVKEQLGYSKEQEVQAMEINGRILEGAVQRPMPRS